MKNILFTLMISAILTGCGGGGSSSGSSEQRINNTVANVRIELALIDIDPNRVPTQEERDCVIALGGGDVSDAQILACLN